MSPRSSIVCVQNVFQAYDMFNANHAPILRQDSHYLQMDQNKIPHDPCHLGVPSGASKMFSEPMVHFMQTVHLSCPDTNIVFKRTERSESPNDPRHLGIPLSASKMISEPMVCSMQTVLLSCVKISTMSKRTETSFHLSLVT